MGKTIDSADSGVEKDDEDYPLKFLGGDVWELNVKDWELDLYIKLTKEEINSLKNIIKSPEHRVSIKAGITDTINGPVFWVRFPDSYGVAPDDQMVSMDIIPDMTGNQFLV